MQGYLQDLQLVLGRPNAASAQCPDSAEEDCPTCGQFQDLRRAVGEIREEYREEIRALRERVSVKKKKNSSSPHNQASISSFREIANVSSPSPFQLASAESRLSSVEECDCRKSCRADGGKIWEDGASWDHQCRVCSCVVSSLHNSERGQKLWVATYKVG